MTYVILDGTLIASGRVAGLRENGNDLSASPSAPAGSGTSPAALTLNATWK